jgi:hypothetical protein
MQRYLSIVLFPGTYTNTIHGLLYLNYVSIPLAQYSSIQSEFLTEPPA